ncbi:hypothetical protein EJV47_21570 [Hymenobacter gummosus]|uniref:TonB C-terminal domain-containing protein n=1 Tax=Hymenobacter gummosus TaxID=1776032 RepID=A0A431TXF7_9BACT|nr:hypothetical protein [Hymenobacter gummosus]RTQ46544.1 hypothetical protein EJV47_21570 [Hymenobacter gummosus]
MKHFLRLFLALLLVSGAAPRVFGQEYLVDGALKLSGQSTDKEYGYKDDYAHCIKVGSPANIIAFINALRGPQGQKVHIVRTGSCCPYEWNEGPNGIGLLARWQVIYDGLDQPITLYLNKNVYDNPLCPVGFTFVTEQTVKPPLRFPADSIRRVRPCAQPGYAVDEPMLRARLGTTLPAPDTAPAPIGDELTRFFADKQLPPSDVHRMALWVTIGFQVTCEGQAGNAMVVSTGKGELETYANQVLAIVNRMPRRWQPATKSGKPVDCYQTISFMLLKGRLAQFDLR